MFGKQQDKYKLRWHKEYGVTECMSAPIKKYLRAFLFCYASPRAVFISIASQLHKLIQSDWEWAAPLEFSASHI